MASSRARGFYLTGCLYDIVPLSCASSGVLGVGLALALPLFEPTPSGESIYDRQNGWTLA